MDPSPRRLELDAILKAISPNLYFQPPASVTMQYPCIVYHLDDIENQYADNLPYRSAKRYQVTVIDRNPDSEIMEAVAKLPSCAFSRAMRVENLNQYVFTLFF